MLSDGNQNYITLVLLNLILFRYFQPKFFSEFYEKVATLPVSRLRSHLKQTLFNKPKTAFLNISQLITYKMLTNLSTFEYLHLYKCLSFTKCLLFIVYAKRLIMWYGCDRYIRFRFHVVVTLRWSAYNKKGYLLFAHICPTNKHTLKRIIWISAKLLILPYVFHSHRNTYTIFTNICINNAFILTMPFCCVS